MNKRIFKRTTALAIIICLLLGTAFSSVAADRSSLASIYYKETYSIGPGVTYESISALDNLGDKQAVRVITVKKGQNVVPDITYGSKIYGRSTLTALTSNLEKAGEMVLGAVNGDFFSFQTGLPLGPIILDGRIVSSDAGSNAAGFLADGTAFIGRPALSFTMNAQSAQNSGQQTSIAIDHVNKLPTPYGVYLLTPDFSANTRSSEPSIEIVINVEGQLKVGEPLQGVVAKVSTGVTKTEIAENTMVLSASGTEPVQRLSALSEGDIVTIESTCSDSRWAQAVTAVGGGELLIENGAVVAGSTAETAPRTALGIKGDGSIVLFEVDGRQNGYSKGMSLKAVAQYLLSAGCVSAINLDGGGSSSMAVRFPHTDKAVLVNKPSDGGLRTIANALVLINKNSQTGVLGALHFTKASPQVYVGSKLVFDVKATDTGGYPMALTAQPSFSATSGSISGNVFTAPSNASVVTVTATSGAVSGTNTIYVVDSIDSFTVPQSLEAIPSEPVQLNVSASKFGIDVAIDNSSFDWTVEGYIGTVDQKGVFTPSSIIGRTGKIIVTLRGQPSLPAQTINVTVGKKPAILADFENGVSDYEAYYMGIASGEIKAESGTGVLLGSGAARLVYNFENAALGSPAAVILSPVSSAAIGDKPKTIDIWVKGDGSGNTLSCDLLDASNNLVPIYFADSQGNSEIGFTDWRKMTAKIPEGTAYPVTFSCISLNYGANAVISKGSILLDQICAGYGGEFDDLMPPDIQITSPADGSELDGSVAVTVNARISDEGIGIDPRKIKLFVNGHQASPTVDGSGNLTCAIDPALTQAGLNRISIEAADRFGNTSRAGLGFILPNGMPTLQFADIGGNWAESLINYIADKQVITGELEEGIRYFRPDRNLSRAEFAVILAKFKGLDAAKYANVGLPFTDAGTIGDWALPAVKMCYSEGWINGVLQLDGSVTFDAGKPITRQEVITILGKMLPNQRQSGSALGFTDAGKIADWARPFVEKVVNFGLINGYPDGTLLPQNTIKRAEIAKIIFCLY